ncbi:hypothetical protein M899_0189 [Bacteriovorax sp. BSW11_IV]|uniref:hypothetical protein n=1 Tax=Bacteriovorax sp. BSW11_IV TaxID=1353529 RepID=UPI00038A0AEB|nr:hypothetical protein [Bacteriovorax sp. BSW11_IV]EQC47072.1 hypothetical protein M899_0189 [Bacteriovorax sp. BSW11_IV]
MFLFKFIFNFSLSFILLSIPVKNKPVFSHIYDVTKPYTQKIITFSEETFNTIYVDVSAVMKKSYSNSSPESLEEDSLSLSASASDEIDSHAESYTDEEKEALKKIFESQGL